MIDDKKIPDFVLRFDHRILDLDIDKQSSAIYRGVMNLIVLAGALDFETGKPPQFNRGKIQDEHIFPKSLYHMNRIPNRTLISTNLKKSNEKLSKYFKKRLQEHGRGEVQAERDRVYETLNEKLTSTRQKVMDIFTTRQSRAIRYRLRLLS